MNRLVYKAICGGVEVRIQKSEFSGNVRLVLYRLGLQTEYVINDNADLDELILNFYHQCLRKEGSI